MSILNSVPPIFLGILNSVPVHYFRWDTISSGTLIKYFSVVYYLGSSSRTALVGIWVRETTRTTAYPLRSREYD